MKFNNCKIRTLGLFASSMLILSGCGGDSSKPPVPDTTPPVFTNAKIDYVVTEGLTLDIDASATDDGGVITYSEDHAQFEIDNIGNLHFLAKDVSSDSSFSVTVTATDEADNNATKIITVTVKDKGIENRTIMPETRGRVFTDRGDTVVNTHTSFLWQKDVRANVNYNQAANYCNGLGLAGVTNWRLPTRTDLNKLINYTNFPVGFDEELNSQIDGAAHGVYWTSEDINDTHAWSISFNGSGGDNELLKTEKIFTRCVSGTHKDADFTLRVDNDTGLEWKSEDANVTYADANLACVAPYRLPTFNEFLSIVEFKPITLFGETGDVTINGVDVSVASSENGFGGNMWTSSSYEENLTKVLYITPAEISDGGIAPTSRAGTICVKP